MQTKQTNKQTVLVDWPSMAENIYSKGTRVWFEDKDHAWISAEVTSATKGSDDTIKLVFLDERGKVRSYEPFILCLSLTNCRKPLSILLERRSKMGKKDCRLCAIRHYWRRLMI
jgi:hypothetical protein